MTRMLSKAYPVFIPLTLLAVFALSSMVFLATRSDAGNDCQKITYTNEKKLSCLLNLEYAESRQERQLGLSGRAYMPADHGMLLVFDKTNRQCIWMKGMRFNLDIIWLNQDKQIVKKLEDVNPKTYPKTFCADNTRYVLELNLGAADELGLGVGDSVKL